MNPIPQLTQSIRKATESRPLAVVLVLAAAVRLLAVVFSKGWGMLDDHFLVIEAAQSWVDGQDYNFWLPGSPGNTGPTGHNLFYPGLHFLFFTFLKWIGLNDPQAKMYLVRLIHAGWSMITVYLGYRIAGRIGGPRPALLAGLLLGLLWFLPFMSVRNLVEMVCVPLLVAGFWILLREGDLPGKLVHWFVAGLLFGLAFNIRVQTALFAVGAGLVVLFRGQWKGLLLMTLGAIIPVLLLQGGIDLFVWGRPFAEIRGYMDVNVKERYEYINLPWYNYFLTLFSMLIPPVSFFLLWGFLRKWRKHLLIFIPVALFFIFHSAYPNKQERFLLPMIPFLLILGSVGWVEFVSTSGFWTRHRKLLSSSWIFFWVVNTILLMTFSLSYSKRARVESMIYLSRYPNIDYILALDAENNPEDFPRFYLRQWPVEYNRKFRKTNSDTLLIKTSREDPSQYPRFVLFTGEKDLQPLIAKTRTYFPKLVYETRIRPGFMDRFLHWINHYNKNRTVVIYRNSEFFPEKATQ